MKSAFIHVLFLLFEICVFGDAETISVIEGESVTLHTGVTDVQRDDLIEWRLNGDLIARIEGVSINTEGASRDRLQLDKQTGDLKITNIKTTDSGEYLLKITSTRGSPEKTFSVSAVKDPRSDGVKVVAVTEGDSVVLHTNTKILKDDEILWRFRGKDVIAKMKKDEYIFSTYDGIANGIFRGRLQLDHQTGNLIISHIRSNTSGLYEVDVKRRTYTIHKAFNVTVTDRQNRTSVKAGVTVTLESGVAELDGDDLVQWRFEHGDVLAEINKTAGISSRYEDVLDGRFRDRLKLDNQTGSLTITHTTTSDSGLYHLDITSVRHVIFRKFILSVSGGVFGGKADEVMTLSAKEGDSVPLNTDVLNKTHNDTMLWYFNETRIAQINRFSNTSCLYDGEDRRFRDRLEVDYETGSLNITHITSEHAGRYEAEIIRSKSPGRRQSLNRSHKCDRTKIIIKKNTHDDTKHKTFIVIITDVPAAERDEVKTVSVKQEEPVTLDLGKEPVTLDPGKEPVPLDLGKEPVPLDPGKEPVTLDPGKEPVPLDPGVITPSLTITPYLTITNTKNTDSGDDKIHLTISTNNIGWPRNFNVSVKSRVSVSVMGGDSVTLNSGIEMKQHKYVKWYLNETLIAQMTGDQKTDGTDRIDHQTGSLNNTDSEPFHSAVSITGDQIKNCTDVQCNNGTERFRDRLKLDPQTGSMTITNTTNTDSGEYQLLIDNSICKNFDVSVTGRHSGGLVEVLVSEGDSVVFHTVCGVTQQSRIRWYFKGKSIAQFTGDKGLMCTDVQCEDGNERFKDRLKLDNQTGSLTIMNTTNTDSGEYELEIININNSSTNIRNINVSVDEVPAAKQDEMKRRKTVKEGESVTLDPGEINKTNDWMTWYFNDTCITEITGDQSKICTDDQCKERFRDRLKVNQTASLIITNTRNTDSGDYNLKIIYDRFNILKSFSVTVTDSGLPLVALAGIGSAVLLVAASVIYSYKRQTSRNSGRRKHHYQENYVKHSSTIQTETPL